MTVKSGQLGHNADTFMSLFSTTALGFSVTIEAKLDLEI